MKVKRNYKTLFTTELDLSDENIRAYKEDLLEQDETLGLNYYKSIDDIDDEDVYRFMYEDVDIDWDNFTSDCNAYDKKHPYSTYEITGSLGLWNGRHNIYPVEEKILLKAIERCLGNNAQEDIVIKEDQFGSMIVEYHHHDGCNIFTIKRKDHNKRYTQNIRFRKEVYGC